MKFSIVTPSFRNSEWLKLCIASVADQEGVDVEHIVQDACSDDGTLDWLPNDTRVKAFIEKDDGMYDAINRGLRRANGDILAYLNCDEQYLPGALKAVEKFFCKYPDVEVALAGTIVGDGKGEYICHRPALKPDLGVIWYKFPVLTSSVFFRKSVVDRSVLFNCKWKDAGDKHWIIDLLKNRVKMKTLNFYTSVFIDSGENMNLKPNGALEKKKTREMAPKWTKICKPLLIAKYRCQKLLAGHFNLKATSYSIYTKRSNEKRKLVTVNRPTSIWWNRMKMGSI